MSEPSAGSESGNSGGSQSPGGETDETPEVGLVPDEALPEDLQPTDDNPLAQDPDDEDDEEDPSEAQVDDLPDMGDPTGG